MVNGLDSLQWVKRYDELVVNAVALQSMEMYNIYHLLVTSTYRLRSCDELETGLGKITNCKRAR